MEAVRSVIYSGNDFSLVGDKGRFVLPPKFRNPVIQSSGDRPQLYIGKHEKWDCLVGFGESRLSEIYADLEEQQKLARERGEDFDYDTKAQMAVGTCEPVTIDGSGRFVVPNGLIKPGRVGGYLEAVGVHDVCLAAGVPVWCGGMLETGIGRATNLALAALPESAPPLLHAARSTESVAAPMVQTAAVPPNQGRICFAITGWTRNSRNALTNTVAA